MYRQGKYSLFLAPWYHIIMAYCTLHTNKQILSSFDIAVEIIDSAMKDTIILYKN